MVYPQWKQVRNKILRNVVQPCQVDTLQSHITKKQIPAQITRKGMQLTFANSRFTLTLESGWVTKYVKREKIPAPNLKTNRTKFNQTLFLWLLFLWTKNEAPDLQCTLQPTWAGQLVKRDLSRIFHLTGNSLPLARQTCCSNPCAPLLSTLKSEDSAQVLHFLMAPLSTLPSALQFPPLHLRLSMSWSLSSDTTWGLGRLPSVDPIS